MIDIEAIKAKIKGVTDQLLTRPIILLRPSGRVSVFNEQANSQMSEVTLPGMVVYGDHQRVRESNTGAQDESMGYVLVNFEELKALDLIVNEPSGERIDIKPNRERLRMDGAEWRITGVEKTAPLQHAYLLAKILFKESS